MHILSTIFSVFLVGGIVSAGFFINAVKPAPTDYLLEKVSTGSAIDSESGEIKFNCEIEGQDFNDSCNIYHLENLNSDAFFSASTKVKGVDHLAKAKNNIYFKLVLDIKKFKKIDVSKKPLLTAYKDNDKSSDNNKAIFKIIAANDRDHLISFSNSFFVKALDNNNKGKMGVNHKFQSYECKFQSEDDTEFKPCLVYRYAEPTLYNFSTDKAKYLENWYAIEPIAKNNSFIIKLSDHFPINSIKANEILNLRIFTGKDKLLDSNGDDLTKYSFDFSISNKLSTYSKPEDTTPKYNFKKIEKIFIF